MLEMFGPLLLLRGGRNSSTSSTLEYISTAITRNLVSLPYLLTPAMDSTVTIGKSYFEALLRRYVHPIYIPHSLAASLPEED